MNIYTFFPTLLKKSSPEDIFPLFLEREEGKEKNIDAREKRRLVASRMYPDWGSNLEPRYVPQWGIDTTTFQLQDGVLTN